jgi:hypothetical protein
VQSTHLAVEPSAVLSPATKELGFFARGLSFTCRGRKAGATTLNNYSSKFLARFLVAPERSLTMRGLTRKLTTIYPALILVACLPLVRAQSSTGKLVGMVSDQAGAVIPNVTVKVRNLLTSVTREASTSSDGAYEILELPTGRYEVSVEARGFNRYVRPQVTVSVNQESRVDIKLQPGDISETVSVNAEASQVQSTSSTLGKVMDEKLISGLPLNGRNFYDLGLLQTGVLPLQPGRTLTQNSYNVNGARDTNNNFLLDGVANLELEFNGPQIRPSIDAFRSPASDGVFQGLRRDRFG